MIIVASPNVLDNFKKQLFDETSLKQKDGLWTIASCTGNKLIDEINPTNVVGLERERVVLQIKNLIKTHYVFMGYIEFANYIDQIAGQDVSIKKLKDEFNDRLLVIDEVHNIRVSDESSKNKVVAEKLMLLISNADRMRLLLLSATPMYNNCTEIIWLLNLLNINDRRPIIKLKKVFDKSGDLTKKGEALLVRKMRGYISYVRGENPYTFPFRIFPKDIDADTAYTSAVSIQMNGRKIDEPTTLDLYAHPAGTIQQRGYAIIMDNIKKTIPNFSEFESINYTILQTPLQALNIIYPSTGKMNEDINILEFSNTGSSSTSSSSSSHNSSLEPEDNDIEEYSSQSKSFSSNNDEPNDESNQGRQQGQQQEEEQQWQQDGGSVGNMTGTDGLLSVVSVLNGKYTYKKKHSGFFKQDNIRLYSSKISKICDHIDNSVGIVLVYSQYIDGGLIPMALALEEMGFRHFNGQLFDPPIPKKGAKGSKGVYAMITGDTANSKDIVNKLTDINNKDGDQIKVILISKTGSEGIDLKYIRQIHIMEPWYNMSRLEQIIGRGVRNGSHQKLPFELRNVEIYMHSTTFTDAAILEPADEYLYRLAEIKAKRIGKITQIMKKAAVDCILNQSQLNFTADNFPNTIRLELSSGSVIEDFQVGDQDYTAQCDYDKCPVPADDVDVNNVGLDTYNIKFAMEGSIYIIDAVKSLMLERHFYTADTLMNELMRVDNFAIEQIYVALSKMIDEKTPIYDKYDKKGTLVNVGNYYLFQPAEILNKNITTFERMVPVPKKPAIINVKMPDETDNPIMREEPNIGILQELRSKYDDILESAKVVAIRGEKDVNHICGSALHLLVRMELIDAKSVVDLLIEYLVDYCEFSNIIDMLNYFTQQNEGIDGSTFEGKVHTYLTTKTDTVDGMPFVGWHDKSALKIIVLDIDTRMWRIVEKEDEYTMAESKKALNKKYETYKDRNNDIVGFIDYDEIGGIMFKTKDTANKRNAGAKCANAGKLKTVKQLNSIIGGQQITFTPINTKSIGQTVLCIMQEFLLRHYNYSRPTKKWFLTTFEKSNL
jgi:hypothetical protein